MTIDKEKIKEACIALKSMHALYKIARSKGGYYIPPMLEMLHGVQNCCARLNLHCSVRAEQLTDNTYQSTYDVFIADWPESPQLPSPNAKPDYYLYCIVFYRTDTTHEMNRKMRLLLDSLYHYATNHEILSDLELEQTYERNK